MSGTTPGRAAKDAFISGCARRGITAAQVVMGSVPEADEVWNETAQAAAAAWVQGAIAAEREATRNWSGVALKAREDILGDVAARAGLEES